MFGKSVIHVYVGAETSVTVTESLEVPATLPVQSSASMSRSTVAGQAVRSDTVIVPVMSTRLPLICVFASVVVIDTFAGHARA